MCWIDIFERPVVAHQFQHKPGNVFLVVLRQGAYSGEGFFQ